MAPGGKTGARLWTRCPVRRSEQLAEVQRELQAGAARRRVEVAAQELAQLPQPIQNGVPVHFQCARSVLDGAGGDIRLESFQQLDVAAAGGLDQRTQAL